MHASQVRSIGDGILQKGQAWYHPERKSPSFGFWWIGHPQAAWQKWCQSWSSAVFFYAHWLKVLVEIATDHNGSQDPRWDRASWKGCCPEKVEHDVTKGKAGFVELKYQTLTWIALAAKSCYRSLAAAISQPRLPESSAISIPGLTETCLLWAAWQIIFKTKSGVQEVSQQEFLPWLESKVMMVRLSSNHWGFAWIAWKMTMPRWKWKADATCGSKLWIVKGKKCRCIERCCLDVFAHVCTN